MTEPVSSRTPIPGELALPGYLLAVLFAAFPVVENFLLIWPFRPGDAPWRFGSVGVMTRALLPVALALLIAGTLATLLHHRRMLRIVTAASGLVTVLLIAVAPLYVLDAVQLRASVKPEAIHAFDVSAVVALLKLILIAVVSAGMARAGWRASRRLKVREKKAVPPDRQRPVFETSGTKEPSA